MRIIGFITLLLTAAVSMSANGSNTSTASGASRVVNVTLTNNSDAPIRKLVLEKRLLMMTHAIDEFPVQMNGTIAPGQTRTVTLRISDTSTGYYHALVWYWADKCYAVSRVPDSGGSFGANTGNACTKLSDRDPVVTPRQAQLAEALSIPFSKANEAYRKKNYSIALSHLNEAILIDPRNEAVLHRRGHTYFESSEYDRAVRDYSAAIDLTKDREHLYIDRADAFLAAKNHNAAINDYSLAIALNASSNNYLLRGKAYYAQKKYDRAAADFTKAIQAYEKNAEAYAYRGFAYTMLGRKDVAAADFTKVTELSPKWFVGYLELGKLLEASKAESLFTKAIELTIQDPKYRAEAYLYRGVSRFLLAKYAEAALDLDEAIKLDPSVPSSQLFRGKVYAEQGDNSTAIPYFTRAHTLAPDAPEPLHERGLAYCRLGKKGEANAEFTKAAALGGQKLTCD